MSGPRFELKRWGFYLVIWRGQYFKIKLLYFKKGGEISLQRHAWRGELWCFIFGSGVLYNYLDHRAKVRSGKRRGDYGLIPARNWHWYKADKPTLVLEAQYGKCEEDDIERYG